MTATPRKAADLLQEVELLNIALDDACRRLTEIHLALGSQFDRNALLQEARDTLDDMRANP